MKQYRLILENWKKIVLIILALLFSFHLMFSTFSYNDGSIVIASKAWSDFASHIPLIRSFSLGNNFPPQYPLFPGEPIRYHFLFYAFVGLLEKLGIRIDFALNLPSALGFFALLLMIYIFTQLLFKDKRVSLLSTVLFLFNGSLSFLLFIKNHPFSPNFISQIVSNQTFSSFGPYDGNIVSAFWNMNIYTNQRHLAFSLAISLFIIFLLLKPILKKEKVGINKILLTGFILGLLFILNMAVFSMSIAVITILFLLFRRREIFLSLIIGALIAIPQYLYFRSRAQGSIIFSPGYLIQNNLNLANFIHYWFYNLGLHFILIPIGFIIVPKNIKKIFVAFFALFAAANLLQFSPEIAANHKFFNYFMIIGVMFSSYVLVYVYDKNKLFRPLILIIIFFLTFSGIIDIFPILNDRKISVLDYPKNPDIKWIAENTPKNSVFLNTSFLYTASSLAGRKIFLGWPYFAWSQGYDTNARGILRDKILRVTTKEEACRLLTENNINYIELQKQNSTDPNIPPASPVFAKEFSLIYEGENHTYSLYDVQKSCNEIKI